jgi:3-hydroxyacyl-CoA dehydrogenase
LREGVPAASIDRAATGFGMAVGPLRLIDEIGLDTTLHAALVLAAAFPDRIVSSPLLISLIKAGRLGQKTGAGFYSYHGSDDDKTVSDLIATWIEPVSHREESENLALRLVLPMLLEATRLLEEQKVDDPRDIDLAALFGLGFPAAKGGLLWWADSLGAVSILRLLQSLRTMGPRAEPTARLKSRARPGDKFYRTPAAAA